MPGRRRTGFWVAGVLGVATVAGVTAFLASPARRTPAVAARPKAAFDAASSFAGLVEGLRAGDSKALAELFRRTVAEAKGQPGAVAADEVDGWVDAFDAMRQNFLRFNPAGRRSALMLVSHTVQRLGIEPAPATWAKALHPAHEILVSGLDDEGLDVRIGALAEVGRLWNWTPGRSMTRTEEDAVDDWKQGFHSPVVRLLADPSPVGRVAAVSCLGELPVDRMAAPALAGLDDARSPAVRKQVLISFARRPALLSEDAVLRHVYDEEDPTVPEVAQLILKTRGLSADQIALGSKIVHKKPEVRASVIPLLKGRSDIDPAVWLIQLSKDAEESVRLAAIDAMSARITPEVGRRLTEMAMTDQSPAVRKSASRFLPESEKTAALPPLPGSPSLNPKAN